MFDTKNFRESPNPHIMILNNALQKKYEEMQDKSF